MRRPPSRAAQVAWIAGPFAVFLSVLAWLWADAPVWDDYDAVLGLLLRAEGVHAPGEWLAMVFAQHNEHRIAVMRMATLALAGVAGQIDFRILMLAGNLALLGTMLFMWREFREVAAPILGAAAIAAFQFSYYEASLMGSAALPHLGVIFFSIGCLYFSLRDGAIAAVLAVTLGLLAAASQANGLFALPVAAAGCLVFHRRRRALVLLGFALAAWALYFHGYHRPPNHPSPLVALSNPLYTAHFFFVVAGGVLPGTRLSAILGLFIVAGLAWTLLRGVWRTHPVVVLWVAFLLASAAAAAVGRVGFGVVHAPRYAIVSTMLIVILGLCAFSGARVPSRGATAATLVGAAIFAIGVSLAVRPGLVEYALRGHLLHQAVPVAPGFAVDRYVGAFYPDQGLAQVALAAASEHGYYHPPKLAVHPYEVRIVERLPATERAGGRIDTVVAAGTRVVVEGWTDSTAARPGRTLYVASRPPAQGAGAFVVVQRQDVAFKTGDAGMLLSGFRMELEYGSEARAREAARALCMASQAAGEAPSRLQPVYPGCEPP